MMRRKGLSTYFAMLAVSALLFSCSAKKNFVKVNGANFTVNNKPYYFVGANFWYGAYLGADTDYGNRERLVRELNQLQKLGVKNLRIVAASEESDFKVPLTPPFQYKNGTYNEKLLQGLDFLLSEMKKRDMHAVLMLNNYWDWTGGMQQYVSWTTGERVYDPANVKTDTWDQAMKHSATFYTNEKAQALYRKYINMIINRKNIYTNKIYKNDPTVMTWQLANEPRPSTAGDPVESMKIFSKWVDDVAGYIHSLAPNQLVSTGGEGSQGNLNKLDYALQSQSSKHIDYMTFHMWPKNWGWYKADQPEMMESALAKTKKYIDEHVDLAVKLNKPTVVEEFGFVRDNEKFAAESPTVARDKYYRFILELLKKSADEGKPLAGMNFWAWGGEGRGQEKDFMWKMGNTSYTGDPYGEAQGLNSVFNTDKTTLDILAEYAHDLEKK
ncbi:glycoside hydrolase 5 family protein [Pedobacter changchengzhani]|nr:cellulase family glycosylhydrolase [Pedobacter changchengzhani]